jgi:hypothetical protein
MKRWWAVALVLLAVSGGAPGSAYARPASHDSALFVADLRRLSVDDQITFTALQGLVNRTSPRIYYVGVSGGQDFQGAEPTGELWLRDAVPLPKKRISDPYELLRSFHGLVRGLVVWDPALKIDTQNVATTMAGRSHLLPVSPAMAHVLTKRPYSFRVLNDLRGEHFASRSAAYEWALTNLGSTKQYGLLAWIGGTRNFVPVGQPGLRDFVVAHRGFAFEAEPITEAQLTQRILDAFPAGMYVYGYPFVDDVVYRTSAMGPIVQAPGEPFGVSAVSRSGKQLVPSSDSVNLTVHSSFPAVAQHPRWDDRPRRPEPGTTYVGFVISDGDNIGFNQQDLRLRDWDNPVRGTIPVGVSISPLLATLAPRIYDYYLRTATRNEVFLSGPSGAGYTYPGYQSDLDGYLRRSKPLLRLAGLRAVWLLDYGYLASPSMETTRRYVEALHPSAIFADYGGYVITNPPDTAFSGDVPVMHGANGENVDNTVSRIRGASFFQLQHQSSAFVFVALVPSLGLKGAKQVMSTLAQPYFGIARSYKAVRPDEFVGLIKYARAHGTQFPPG